MNRGWDLVEWEVDRKLNQRRLKYHCLSTVFNKLMENRLRLAILSY